MVRRGAGEKMESIVKKLEKNCWSVMIWHIYVFSLRPISFNIRTIMMTINTVWGNPTPMKQMFPGRIKQICVSLWMKTIVQHTF